MIRVAQRDNAPAMQAALALVCRGNADARLTTKVINHRPKPGMHTAGRLRALNTLRRWARETSMALRCCGYVTQVGSIVRGAFNPADLQRFSPQSGPVGGENLARPA